MSMNDIKAKALTAFANIGTKNGTSAPDSQDNRASIAHEMFIADALASAATKRKEAAKKQALDAGIIRDEYKEGSTEEVYSNEHLTLAAKTASGANRLDADALKVELMKELGTDKAMKLIAKCTKTNKPATSYIFASK